MDLRYRWEPAQVVHREDDGRIDHAVQHQSMLRRINCRYAAMMTLIKQAAWRDDAVEFAQWRAARRRDVLRLVRQDVANDLALVRRGVSVKFGADRSARCFHRLRDRRGGDAASAPAL